MNYIYRIIYVIFIITLLCSCNTFKRAYRSKNKSAFELEQKFWQDTLNSQKNIIRKFLQENVHVERINEGLQNFVFVEDDNHRINTVEDSTAFNKLTLYPIPLYEISQSELYKWRESQPLEELLTLDRNRCYAYLSEGKKIFYKMMIEKKDGNWKMNSIEFTTVNSADSISTLFFKQKITPYQLRIIQHDNHKKYTTAYKVNGVWMYMDSGGASHKLKDYILNF